MAAWLRSFVVASVVVTASSASSTVLAKPIDRLVAVVDQKPIFLSELKERAVPHLRRIQAAAPDQVRRDVMTAEMYKELVSRLIDEEIVRRDAGKLKLSVDDKEIDTAVTELAKQSNLSREALEKAVLEQGLTVQQYREEISRQILEGKWVQTKLRSSQHAPKKTAGDREYLDAVEKFRKKLLEELRNRAYVEVML